MRSRPRQCTSLATTGLELSLLFALSHHQWRGLRGKLEVEREEAAVTAEMDFKRKKKKQIEVLEKFQ